MPTKKLIVLISRILVGALFIVSGLIKSNDAVGFSIKLQEYFEPGALNMTGLMEYALGLAIFICVAEVLLGIAILIGALPKLTSALLLVLILFFTWLTYYTDTCDPYTKKIVTVDGVEQEIEPQCVLTCGCFGNAIDLTPRESFYKDLGLLFFIVIIVIGAYGWAPFGLNSAKEDIIVVAGSLAFTAGFSLALLDWTFPVIFTFVCLAVAIMLKRRLPNSKAKEWIIAGAITVLCCIFQFYTYYYLPMKDYRPYAVGKSIPEGMKTAEEMRLEPPTYYNLYTLTNESTGETKKVQSNDYMSERMWEDKAWKITGTSEETFLLKDGYKPLILDFILESLDGEDLTDALLSQEKPIVLQVSQYFDKIKTNHQDEINELYKAASENGFDFYGVSPSGYEQTETFRHDHQAGYEFLVCDQTELKTMIRSNPGIVLLQQGVVRGKWANADIPSLEDLQEALK